MRSSLIVPSLAHAAEGVCATRAPGERTTMASPSSHPPAGNGTAHTTTSVTCPHRGRTGTSKVPLRDGAEAKCPGCKQSFTVAIPIPVAETVDETPTILDADLVAPPARVPGNDPPPAVPDHDEEDQARIAAAVWDILDDTDADQGIQAIPNQAPTPAPQPQASPTMVIIVGRSATDIPRSLGTTESS
jgi:hypothetical protein